LVSTAKANKIIVDKLAKMSGIRLLFLFTSSIPRIFNLFASVRATLTSFLLSFLVFSLLYNSVIAAEQEKEPATEKKISESTADKAVNKKPSVDSSDDASTSDNKSSDGKPASNESGTEKESTDAEKNKRIINPPINAFKQQQQDLKHYLNSDGVEAILVGTDEFIMLTDKHKTAINKGVMILVPDWQQSAASPNAIKKLRDNMPDQGWTTLTVHPPHQPGNYPSQALTTEERLKENNESLANYQKKLSAVIESVTNKAKNYPGVILIVAEGQHAALVVDMIQNLLIEPPAALVMLSSYMPTGAENTKLAEQVAASDYPILDLYLKHDHRLVLASTKNRKTRTKNEMKVYYRQKQLSNQMTGYYPKYSLTREIIGWLKSIGW
jgi:hypothetical protein